MKKKYGSIRIGVLLIVLSFCVTISNALTELDSIDLACSSCGTINNFTERFPHLDNHPHNITLDCNECGHTQTFYPINKGCPTCTQSAEIVSNSTTEWVNLKRYNGLFPIIFQVKLSAVYANEYMYPAEHQSGLYDYADFASIGSSLDAYVFDVPVGVPSIYVVAIPRVEYYVGNTCIGTETLSGVGTPNAYGDELYLLTTQPEYACVEVSCVASGTSEDSTVETQVHFTG